MYKYLYYLVQPGVVSTGLLGTSLQIGIAFANTFDIGGAAAAISEYGLSGQLASGGLIAALTGAYYSLTQRKVAQTVAAGAGAVAGGISGTLGTAITQSLGWTEVAAGTTPLLNFTAISTALMGALGAADPATVSDPMFDTLALTQVFGSTAVGGGIGAFLGQALAGRKSKRRAHA
jgi:ABC-type uncharacterized transport system permease subunit